MGTAEYNNYLHFTSLHFSFQKYFKKDFHTYILKIDKKEFQNKITKYKNLYGYCGI